jgi:hypothetical protein
MWLRTLLRENGHFTVLEVNGAPNH